MRGRDCGIAAPTGRHPRPWRAPRPGSRLAGPHADWLRQPRTPRGGRGGSARGGLGRRAGTLVRGWVGPVGQWGDDVGDRWFVGSRCRICDGWGVRCRRGAVGRCSRGRARQCAGHQGRHGGPNQRLDHQPGQCRDLQRAYRRHLRGGPAVAPGVAGVRQRTWGAQRAPGPRLHRGRRGRSLDQPDRGAAGGHPGPRHRVRREPRAAHGERESLLPAATAHPCHRW